MKIPRKLKKQIPVGFYCYEGIHMDWETGEYKIKPCPFYSGVKIEDVPLNQRPEWLDQEYIDEFGTNDTISWCKLLKNDIDDQCKKCGLRYGL
jgi:hypothetical protein